MKINLNIILILSAAVIAAQVGYFQGWHVRDATARTGEIEAVEANRAAISRATQALTAELLQANRTKDAAEAAYQEALSYETNSDSSSCGIPVDGVRLLQQIR